MTSEFLTIGLRYDLSTLAFLRWSYADGSTPHPNATEGYCAWDYFANCAYLGPDMYGIEPVFKET